MFTSPPPEYLFKADDDVFVNLPLLYEKLCGPYEMGRSARGPYDNVTNLLIGNLYEGNRTKVRKVGHDILNLSTIISSISWRKLFTNSTLYDWSCSRMRNPETCFLLTTTLQNGTCHHTCLTETSFLKILAVPGMELHDVPLIVCIERHLSFHIFT